MFFETFRRKIILSEDTVWSYKTRFQCNTDAFTRSWHGRGEQDSSAQRPPDESTNYDTNWPKDRYSEVICMYIYAYASIKVMKCSPVAAIVRPPSMKIVWVTVCFNLCVLTGSLGRRISHTLTVFSCEGRTTKDFSQSPRQNWGMQIFSVLPRRAAGDAPAWTVRRS